MEQHLSNTTGSTRQSPRSSPLAAATSPSASRPSLDTTPGARRSFMSARSEKSIDSDAGIVAQAAERGLPSPPVEEFRNQAPGIPDRRRSQRPSSVRVSGGEGSLSVRRGKSAKGLGPKIPVKVSPTPTPTKTPTMADMRSRMRAQEDDNSDTSTFEDANESVSPQPSQTPSRNANVEDGEEEATVGLGSKGGEGTAVTQSAPEENKEDVDGDFKPKMSARLSKWESDDPVMFVEEDETNPASTHSLKNTADVPSIVAEGAEAEGQARNISQEVASAQSSRPISTISTRSTQVPNGRTLDQEMDGESNASQSPVDNDQTPVAPSHSRQNTLETAPTLVMDGASRSRSSSIQMSPTREPRSRSRQAAEPISSPPQNEGGLSMSGIRAGLASHSRNSTAESIPNLPPPLSDADRDQSVSPSNTSRQQSPTRTAPGLSGDVTISSPPPSSVSRIKALEQRHIGEKPSSPSPPPQSGGLMRTASTRMGAFLGRMGSMRKPGKSPPAPRQERFSAERRNTAASTASMASGHESLATIADGPEGEEGNKPRLSLQDQFQCLRKQEEYSVPGANGYFLDGDDEQTPVARKFGDAEFMSSPTRESPESRSHRGSSTPSLLRSPPMNPSLPPGTASGMTAGPAEEPRPVDWDLWQKVVDEGPSGVAKTSSEELNRAIASGIPAPIRGVVWQVLAESKNEELENVYRTLKARGTADAEHLAPNASRPTPMSRESSQNNVTVTPGAENGEKESQASSSRSSVHSQNSTPPTTVASPPASVQGEDQDLKSKLMAEKQKREAAALAKLEKAIKRDMGSRTSYSKFAQAAGLQDGLFGVCKAYALFDEGVGYAQGINFIAMPLLFNMAEEEAFTLLVRLMSKYDLRSMFTGDMAGLHLRLYQFERLLEDHDPALYCHLRRRNVGPQLYATQWFLTLFAYRFPLQLVLRVYDLIFSEGLIAIMKFGLVLMQHNRDTLLGMKDMSHLSTFLKEKLFDVYIDKAPSAHSLMDSGFFGTVTGGADKELYRADEMVRDACDISISELTLSQYTTEWEESQRHNQERDSELEDLRASHNALSVKVKALEERTQQQDDEHVTLASDLVKIKVENDGLLDENEGLKMKVEELQKLLDTQPDEVEAKVKDEMDRIVQKNEKVQAENRQLQEQMEEMEEEVVNAKMQRAQTQSEYDALIQKWSSLQAMLTDK